MPDEEDLWIERARRGDVESFSRVVLLRQGYVRAFLGRFTGHPDVVDDLAQETFLRAWRKLETFRAEGRFSTWLFGIAVNEFRARLRRDRRHLWEDLDGQTAETEPATGPSLHGLRLDLDEALLRLTLPERAAILLCCQQGLTHEEAAQTLRAPLGTVKTNILRGKEKLRRWLRT